MFFLIRYAKFWIFLHLSRLNYPIVFITSEHSLKAVAPISVLVREYPVSMIGAEEYLSSWFPLSLKKVQ